MSDRWDSAARRKIATGVYHPPHMAARILDDNHWLTRVLYSANRLFSRNYHDVKVLSPCQIPREGPVIVISNHISSLDPFLIQSTCPRVIRWMMAREYFDMPVARTLCGKLGFIPVTRTGRDPTSLKSALRTLEAGHVLGIFPEGRIAPTMELLPFQPGLAMIAQRTSTPICPVAIEGVPRNLSLVTAMVGQQDARVCHGAPIEPTGEAKDITAALRKTIQTLQIQALAK